MKRLQRQYVCEVCSARSPKWMGRCVECGAWDSFVEQIADLAGSDRSPGFEPAGVERLGDLDGELLARIDSGVQTLDRVLGGGLVPGGTVLLAGEPGIGKSTLLLQLASGLLGQGRSVLYVSAEESSRQLSLRAERIGCQAGELAVVSDTHLEAILDAIAGREDDLVLVDSVQALRSSALEGPPGSLSQVRYVANRLVDAAKRGNAALVLVGHVTKDGAIAGPKSLEHLVDTVLAFEGESSSGHRIVQAAKNRFGPTGEVALFEMGDRGLDPVLDPSRVLISNHRGQTAGSAVTASLQGTRPLLVEVQALVQRSTLAAPRRVALGCESGRLALLVAVLERFGAAALADQDVFVNVVGGLPLREPAADLAICAALVSARHDRPLAAQTVFFGEVGLLGEIRGVSRLDERLRQAQVLGYKRAVMPIREAQKIPADMNCVEVADLTDLLSAIRAPQ